VILTTPCVRDTEEISVPGRTPIAPRNCIEISGKAAESHSNKLQDVVLELHPVRTRTWRTPSSRTRYPATTTAWISGLKPLGRA
jgi:hypothetical protein